MSSLDNKVVLVTGSSRGIGAAIARLFAQEGAKVAVHGRDLAALSAVQTEIKHAGGQAMQVVGDVTRFADIEALAPSNRARVWAHRRPRGERGR